MTSPFHWHAEYGDIRVLQTHLGFFVFLVFFFCFFFFRNGPIYLKLYWDPTFIPRISLFIVLRKEYGHLERALDDWLHPFKNGIIFYKLLTSHPQTIYFVFLVLRLVYWHIHGGPWSHDWPHPFDIFLFMSPSTLWGDIVFGLFVCPLQSLSAQLLWNYWFDFDETWHVARTSYVVVHITRKFWSPSFCVSYALWT